MPLALSGGASAPSARDRCNGVSGSVHNVVYRPQTLVALWPLPEKSPPWSALVAVDDYVPPLSRLIHALKFSGQSSLAQPLARLLLLAVLQARRTAHCRKSTWW
jgi:hypothetical protein